jgi:hypothetical protein
VDRVKPEVFREEVHRERQVRSGLAARTRWPRLTVIFITPHVRQRERGESQFTCDRLGNTDERIRCETEDNLPRGNG